MKLLQNFMHWVKLCWKLHENIIYKNQSTSNERSNVAEKRKGPASLFGREAEVSVGALKTKSCLSEASSFCLAETLTGVAQKVQTANFLCFVSFLRGKEMKSHAARAKLV